MFILNAGATNHIIQEVPAYSLCGSLKLLVMFHPVIIGQIFKMLQQIKRELGVFPSTGLK